MRLDGYDSVLRALTRCGVALVLLASGLVAAVWLTRPAPVSEAPASPVALTVSLIATPRCQPPSARPACRRRPLAVTEVRLAGSATPLVTDRSGRLALTLPPGRYRLTVAGVQVPLVVSAGQSAITLAVATPAA